MDCQHNNQYPDKSRKMWMCRDCGQATIPFFTEAERELVRYDDKRARGIVTVIENQVVS